MTEIPAAIVEKAAKASCEIFDTNDAWADLSDATRWAFRTSTRAALEAVYADIKAEALLEAADAWAAYIKAMGYGTTGPIDFLQRRADQIGGQS